MVKPKVLVHVCCAPDSTAVFERLGPDYEVVGFFHNPNIQPEKEYKKRLNEAKKVAHDMEFPIHIPAYKPKNWLKEVKGLEDVEEGGLRCEICFRYNLRATAKAAQKLNIPFFTTTLTISPHKDSDKILALGKEAAAEYKVQFLDINFKKQAGFQRSLELSKTMQLYRQNYCGCSYSHARTTRG